MFDFGACKIILLLQLPLSIKKLTSGEVKARKSAFLFDQKHFYV